MGRSFPVDPCDPLRRIDTKHARPLEHTFHTALATVSSKHANSLRLLEGALGFLETRTKLPSAHGKKEESGPGSEMRETGNAG